MFISAAIALASAANRGASAATAAAAGQPPCRLRLIPAGAASAAAAATPEARFRLSVADSDGRPAWVADLDCTVRTGGEAAGSAVSGSDSACLTAELRPLGSTAALIALRIANGGDGSLGADIAVDCALPGGGGALARLERLAWGGGFSVESGNFSCAFLVADAWLVRNASTFWFGDASVRAASRWLQTGSESFAAGGGLEGAGFAFSWQGVSVPAGGFRTVGWLVRLSGSVRDDRLVGMECSLNGSSVDFGGVASVRGRVFSGRAGSVLSVFGLFVDEWFALERFVGTCSLVRLLGA
jgi:hypothetical protein